jgi:hypothetical protein
MDSAISLPAFWVAVGLVIVLIGIVLSRRRLRKILRKLLGTAFHIKKVGSALLLLSQWMTRRADLRWLVCRVAC